MVGVAVVDKEVFSRRTADYQAWVEAFARNHRLPIEWAEKGVRKEHHVLPWQRRMARDDAYGVSFIFKSMEQEPSFRVSVPKYPTKSLTSRKRGIQMTGSSPANAAASRTPTSTSATKPWAR